MAKSNTSRRAARKEEIQRRKRQKVALLLTAGVASVALLAAIVITNVKDNKGSASAEVTMEHIHGLGVDPQTNELYAGSHYGLYRIDKAGSATRVGPSRDYMGFTVVGSDRFLASGHPSGESSGPANLGLIESTDKGSSWHTLSLSGKADFHGLAASGNRIYGYNAGKIMVSDDGKTWQTRASVAIHDIAVRPEAPDTIVATSHTGGLLISTDAGRTFTPMANSPAVVLVEWQSGQTLVGVTAQGITYVSTDAGATWQQRATTNGSPEALAVTNNTIFVATDNGIYESTDAGASFTQRYRMAA